MYFLFIIKSKMETNVENLFLSLFPKLMIFFYDKKVTKINGMTDKRMNEASEGQTVREVIRILDYTGCSLNIVFFFENFKIYSGLWPHHQPLQQNWQSPGKSHF